MRTLIFSAVALLALALLPLLVTAQPRPNSAAAATGASFVIDGGHSSVVFKIKHLGVGDFYGRFNDISGEFVWNEADPTASRVNVTVTADSVDSGNEQRDNHLRSPDFFNAREHQNITFVSKNLKALGNDEFEMTGDLTLHGVTKTISATLVWNGAGDRGSRFGYRGGVSATFTIKRTDFGMDTYVEGGMLGDEVTLLVGLEGQRK